MRYKLHYIIFLLESVNLDLKRLMFDFIVYSFANHFQLWEDVKHHNLKLQKELSEVKTDLESVRCQLETMAIRVGHNFLQMHF